MARAVQRAPAGEVAAPQVVADVIVGGMATSIRWLGQVRSERGDRCGPVHPVVRRGPPDAVHLEVYVGAISRTNIDIDDELVERAMRRYLLDSKRAAVQLALEQLVGSPMTTDEALAMEGVGYPVDNDDLEGSDDPAEVRVPRRRSP